MIRKIVALTCGLLFFTSNVACLYAVETNVWAERRRHSEAARQNETSPQLASIKGLPTSEISFNRLLHNIMGVGESLGALSKHSSITSTSHASLQKHPVPFIENIPLNAGSIRDVYVSPTSPGESSRPFIFLIQDIHQNYEAQKNIVAILQSLAEADPGKNRTRGLLVGVEGAFGPLDFNLYRLFPDKKLIRKVADYFLEKGKIAAPSYVGLTLEGTGSSFVGVDDPLHYQKNVKAYLTAAASKEVLNKKLAISRSHLATLKRSGLNADLAFLDDRRAAFETGKLGLGEYVKVLFERSQQPRELVLEKFQNAYEMEKTLDFSRVESERMRVIEKLASQLNPSDLKSLFLSGLAYRTGKISYADYYQTIKSLLDRASISLAQAPHFDRYIRYVILADGINAESLLAAVKRLETDVVASLIQTKEERALVDRSRYLSLVAKLLEFGLVPEEWTEYKSCHRTTLVGSEDFSAELTPFEQFYEEADVRSQKIVERMMEGAHPTLVALLVGGFHTPQMTQLLRKKGLSYAVVQPRISKVEDASGTSYLSIFSKEKTPIDQLFAGQKLFLAPHSTALGTSVLMSALRTGASFLGVMSLLSRRAGEEIPAGVPVVMASGDTRVDVQMPGLDETVEASIGRDSSGEIVAIPGEPVITVRSTKKLFSFLRMWTASLRDSWSEREKIFSNEFVDIHNPQSNVQRFVRRSVIGVVRLSSTVGYGVGLLGSPALMVAGLMSLLVQVSVQLSFVSVLLLGIPSLFIGDLLAIASARRFSVGFNVGTHFLYNFLVAPLLTLVIGWTPLSASLPDDNPDASPFPDGTGAASIAAAGHTERNEDAYFVMELPGGIHVAGVFDGVGGDESGEIASRIARDSIMEELKGISGTETKDEMIGILSRAMVNARDAINSRLEGKKSGTAATVMVSFPPGDVFIASAADTRAYLLDEQGRFRPLTVDNSRGNADGSPFVMDESSLQANLQESEQESLDEISSLQDLSALRDPTKFIVRNVIANSLRTGSAANAYRPVLTVIKVKPGERIFLTSDGVHDPLTRQQLLELTNKPSMPPLALAQGIANEAAREVANPENYRWKGGGGDDVTVVVVEIGHGSHPMTPMVRTDGIQLKQPPIQPKNEPPALKKTGVFRPRGPVKIEGLRSKTEAKDHAIKAAKESEEGRILVFASPILSTDDANRLHRMSLDEVFAGIESGWIGLIDYRDVGGKNRPGPHLAEIDESKKPAAENTATPKQPEGVLPPNEAPKREDKKLPLRLESLNRARSAAWAISKEGTEALTVFDRRLDLLAARVSSPVDLEEVLRGLDTHDIAFFTTGAISYFARTHIDPVLIRSNVDAIRQGEADAEARAKSLYSGFPLSLSGVVDHQGTVRFFGEMSELPSDLDDALSRGELRQFDITYRGAAEGRARTIVLDVAIPLSAEIALRKTMQDFNASNESGSALTTPASILRALRFLSFVGFNATSLSVGFLVLLIEFPQFFNPARFLNAHVNRTPSDKVVRGIGIALIWAAMIGFSFWMAQPFSHEFSTGLVVRFMTSLFITNILAHGFWMAVFGRAALNQTQLSMMELALKSKQGKISRAELVASLLRFLPKADAVGMDMNARGRAMRSLVTDVDVNDGTALAEGVALLGLLENSRSSDVQQMRSTLIDIQRDPKSPNILVRLMNPTGDAGALGKEIGALQSGKRPMDRVLMLVTENNIQGSDLTKLNERWNPSGIFLRFNNGTTELTLQGIRSSVNAEEQKQARVKIFIDQRAERALSPSVMSALRDLEKNKDLVDLYLTVGDILTMAIAIRISISQLTHLNMMRETLIAIQA